MSGYFEELDELIDFDFSNDGFHLFDQQHTAEAAIVQQQQQRQNFNYINAEDAVVVGNVNEKEGMQKTVDGYCDAKNTTMEETQKSHHHHHINDNNYIVFDPSVESDINGLLNDDDDEMLAYDDIIFADQMATATITATSGLPSSSISASTSDRNLNGGELIKIKPDPVSATNEIEYEFQKVTKCKQSFSYIQRQPQSKYIVLNDEDVAGGDDVEEEASGAEEAAIVDDIIIEETRNLTNSGDYEDIDAVVPVSLIKTVIGGCNSPSSSSVRSAELQQQQQDVKRKSAYTTIAIPQRSPNSNRKTLEEHTGPLRYMLFDNLIATIVDFDADETPIIEFSNATNESDYYLPVECGICPKVVQRSKLRVHLLTHFLPEKKLYGCEYCKKGNSDYKYMAAHTRRHMGIRPYFCGECKLSFSTKHDLSVHNQRRHDEKKFTCEICGKIFAQRTLLKRHRESLHEKKRSFHCPMCPKVYCKKYSLKEHIRNIHNGKRRVFVCPFCGIECRNAHEMAKHRKDNHLNQSVYVCDVCCEEFTHINYFDAHKRSIQCRSNTQRKQEGNNADVLINNGENKENSTKTNATTNQSSYSTNTNLNTSLNSQLKLKTHQRQKQQNLSQNQQQQEQKQQQQQNDHNQFQILNMNGSINESIVPDVIDCDDEEKAKTEDESGGGQQQILVESLVDKQGDLIYKITLV